MDPELELQRLELRYKTWKKEFKVGGWVRCLRHYLPQSRTRAWLGSCMWPGGHQGAAWVGGWARSAHGHRPSALLPALSQERLGNTHRVFKQLKREERKLGYATSLASAHSATSGVGAPRSTGSVRGAGSVLAHFKSRSKG